MLIKKHLFAVCVLFFTATAAAEYEFATGFGHQYGGIIGAQFSSKTDRSKIYASLGLLGASFGFQKQFEGHPKHAYGMNLGVVVIAFQRGHVFATYNYHVDGFSNKGWVIGAGVGFVHKDDIFSTDDPIEPSITLDFGYKF